MAMVSRIGAAASSSGAAFPRLTSPYLSCTRARRRLRQEKGGAWKWGVQTQLRLLVQQAGA